MMLGCHHIRDMEFRAAKSQLAGINWVGNEDYCIRFLSRMRIATTSILMISSKSMQILHSVLEPDADCYVYGMDAEPRSNILHQVLKSTAHCNNHTVRNDAVDE